MVLLGVGLGGTVGVATEACHPTPESTERGFGGGRAHVDDADGYGNGDQTSIGEDASRIVGAVSAPEQGAPLRLKFLRLTEQTQGSGTDFQFLPGSDEVLITLREGRLARMSLGERHATARDVWTFREEMITSDACGPSNLALDPAFLQNRFIYVTYCASATNNRLVRYTLDEENGPKDPLVEYEMESPAGQTSWRRFGSLGWLDGETLWLLVGDHEQSRQAQEPDSALGSLVFLRPNRDLVADTKGVSSSPKLAIHARGFRAPWRGTRDQLGRFFVGDVGEDDYEELNLVSGPGQNFGWDLYTGPCAGGCTGAQGPVAYYDRSPRHPLVVQEPSAISSASRAIWVGQVYEGAAIDRYQGWLTHAIVFGDLFTGSVRALQLDAGGLVVDERAIGFLPYVTQWRVGPDGYIYVLDLAGNLHVALLDGSQLH